MIYGFSYYAIVFVRLDRKSLPMTNILAYYENPLFTDKKSFYNIDPWNSLPSTNTLAYFLEV
jgi:hypothetical protein